MWGARRVPGAIVAATADHTHPLLFGWGDGDVHLFKSTSLAFEASPRRARTPLVYTADPLVSGYLHVNSIGRFRISA